jgi:hypothetical protein
MTPEERQLITGLFDRMRGFALTGKDGEADALIKQQVGSLPDAPYMLVQSVLVQEHALQQADNRIKALEDEVQALQEAQQQAQQQAQAAPGGGSFLGGLFGSRAAPEPDRQPERGVSVPAVGARATPSVYGGQSAWAAPQAGTHTGGPGAPPQAVSAGGGFLQSAMATAAGVAGGMLAANAIGSWLGTGQTHTGASTATTAPPPQPTQPTAADTATPGATQASHTSEGGQAPDRHDAAYEDDGGWFGEGGDDFDI